MLGSSFKRGRKGIAECLTLTLPPARSVSPCYSLVSRILHLEAMEGQDSREAVVVAVDADQVR